MPEEKIGWTGNPNDGKPYQVVVTDEQGNKAAVEREWKVDSSPEQRQAEAERLERELSSKGDISGGLND